MALEIRGLTQRQQVLADILWATDSRKAVNRFVAALPTEELRLEAYTLIELMILSVQDEVTDLTEAEQVLNRLKNG